jgi:chemotaxis protein MotA
MNDRKSDIGSLIGIALGFVVIFWGMTDWPAGKIADKKAGPTWDQKLLSQPLGHWDEEWQATIDFTAKKEINRKGYFVGFNSFLDLKSFFLVLGGVLAATFVALPLASFGSVFQVLKVVFRNDHYNYVQTINRICERAEKARKEGLLSLEADLSDMKNIFFKKGIEIAINTKEVTGVRRMLETEKEYIESRHISGQEMFNYMSAYAPAFGMMGTVMGLVVMMSGFGGVNVSGVEESTSDKFAGLLGGMSMALITTFYGVVMANLFFTPFAGKLKRKSEMEMLHKNVIIEGVVSIKQNEHPILIREKLMVMVPPDVALELDNDNTEHNK